MLPNNARIDDGHATRFSRHFPGFGFLPFRRRARPLVHRSYRTLAVTFQQAGVSSGLAVGSEYNGAKARTDSMRLGAQSTYE